MTWPTYPLGQVADTALGKMLDKGKPKGLPHVPYLRNINVQWGRVDTSSVLTMELGEHEHERFGLRAGDLLICEGGEPGRCAVWQGSSEFMAFQKALHRARPGPNLTTGFLRYYLEHLVSSGGIAKFCTGSTIAHLPQQQLRRVPVPLPPVAEQQRIVEILEEHLSRLDAAAADLTRANVRLESLSEAALQVLIPGDAVRRPLSEVLEEPLSNGRSVPSRDGGFPVLRLTALKEDGVDLEERKGGAWERAEAVRFLVKEGDFLIARGNGSLRLVGKGSLLRHEPDEVAFPDTAIRARARPSAVLPEFLSLVWNSRSTRDQIERVARTSAGIYKVNQSQLGAIQLPVPELSEQMSIVAAMSRLQEHRHVALETIDIATRRSHSLRRAVLAAAFEGKLTGRHMDVEVVEELAGA